VSKLASLAPAVASPHQPAETDGEFWQRVLVAGGFTAIPRWTLDPVAGVAEHEVAIPDELATPLRRVARQLGVPLSSVLLAAHAKVLAALSGERDVTTGYLPMNGGRPVPCRLTTEPGSWRALVLETRRVESELLSHRYFPVDDLRSELGLTEPQFETEFDPAGAGGDLAADTVLRVGVSRSQCRLVARLRYRTEALDADCAGRIAGYHLAALTRIAADPEAGHGRQSLLSAEEMRHQLEGLGGPRRELPARRVHELFEQRVEAHPDAVAAVQGDRSWTYRELNDRANRLGRALLARGLRREGVVAVVTERNLDWIAAVLAVFKAGGVYLPIEPHFPAERIATVLSRAGCGLVLTERGSTGTLDHALDAVDGVDALLIRTAYEEGHDGRNIGVAVAADQLAYIYFTSGSTGEPKGAMCEHAGMLNHLYAKIEDLEIGEGEVVAQTAPQCFDISLWQLASALLVGGRTLLVEQGVILDVERFVDTIVGGRVAVLQVVPSYLEAVLSYLEQHPRELPDLRYVSVTGEALGRELVERWFAAQPQIKLVNAYGLTETSDDTNHEVMDRVPVRERVPLGPPVNNVHVYVVDERLSPVPLGAPGEIVFSGVCVGRGYVNDPDRTRLAFIADPHREGRRLYRSGDHGRWLPEGKLEFLGRRDSQVKIRGFRIEIGEIETTLSRVPGVGQGAVVVAEGADRGRHLVAFYTADRPVAAEVLRDRLAESLPEYMVPSAFHRRESLPLTDNGKVDRKALTALAGELGAGGEDYDTPATAAEQRVAAAWADVLGVAKDRLGRRDHFFDRGGTSLSAVKLVIALDRAVSLKEVTRLPILADQARLVDGTPARHSGPLLPPNPPRPGRAGGPARRPARSERNLT
jgi:amino acid adenylation domain-containing protein